jgi:hypothetical protein
VPCSRLIFVRRERPAKHGLDAQGIKIIPAYSSPLDERGGTIAGEIETQPSPFL